MKERKDIVSEGCLSDLMSDNGHRLQHYKDIRNENLTIMDLSDDLKSPCTNFSDSFMSSLNADFNGFMHEDDLVRAFHYFSLENSFFAKAAVKHFSSLKEEMSGFDIFVQVINMEKNNQKNISYNEAVALIFEWRQSCADARKKLTAKMDEIMQESVSNIHDSLSDTMLTSLKGVAINPLFWCSVILLLIFLF